VSALDAFLDIALADELTVCFQTPMPADDEAGWRERARYWQDPRTLVGGSDAGAHLDMMSTFAYFTDVVGPSVRERNLWTIEDAVHQLTGAPADFYGLRDRGHLAPGSAADVVVFDSETVGVDHVVLRDDMPNEELRLFAEATGIAHVLVNGGEIVSGKQLTGQTPGAILRPGSDTGPRRQRDSATFA
jgi:N-acyl-D-aspartate/D-glutamate deacylase